MADVGQLQSVLDPHTRTRHGMCPLTLARCRDEPPEKHSLYFEVHGSGPQKIVFIMGVNHDSFTWLPQVEHFGKLEQYSTLVFDNRGIGRSLVPRGLYSAAGMAEDTLCLLDYLGWTEDRSLHIVGISMGGMIAQELACRIPNRLMSLSLIATRAGGSWWANIPKFSVLLCFARLFATSDIDKHFPIIASVLYTQEWLDGSAENDPQGRANSEVEREVFRRRMEISGPQTIRGAIGQMAAVLAHRMTPDRLATVSASVPKVLILSAAEDVAIPYIEGEKLKRHMPEAEYQCWEKTGHGICIQHKARFNRLLQKVFEQGKEAAEKCAAST